MAKISETHGRKDANSGYARLLGQPELGKLISILHATVIRTGNELDFILEADTPAELKTDLNTAINFQGGITEPKIQIAFHPSIHGGEDKPGIRADIVVFDHEKRIAKVIEVKDGDTFDTKKASGELASMRAFADWIIKKTGYPANYFFCCFNQDSKEAIVKGAKNRFGIANAMTGKELCEILHIDYNSIRTKRQCEQIENRDYFLNELLNIPDVRKQILAILLQDKEITLHGG
jgi:hypothetical protein